LVGGLAGTTVEHVTGDTTAFEYIVRKPNGDLVSVTQKDKTPLALGQKVLVISGNQARVVPDYTVPPSVQSAKAGETASKSDAASSEAKPGDTKPADVKSGDTKSGDVKPGEAAAAAAPAGTASTAAPAATTSVGTPAASSTGTATPSEPKPPAAVPSGTVAAPTPGSVTSGAPPPTDRTAVTAAKPANATP
jgi:outer membrane lipoprotein SlyB